MKSSFTNSESFLEQFCIEINFMHTKSLGKTLKIVYYQFFRNLILSVLFFRNKKGKKEGGNHCRSTHNKLSEKTKSNTLSLLAFSASPRNICDSSNVLGHVLVSREKMMGLFSGYIFLT